MYEIIELNFKIIFFSLFKDFFIPTKHITNVPGEGRPSYVTKIPKWLFQELSTLNVTKDESYQSR